MTSQTLYNLFLTTHIGGFILFAGTTVVDFFVFRQFWRLARGADSLAIRTGIFSTIGRFPALMGVGVITTILAGVGMMAITKGVFGEQIWMKIKIALVILALANGIIFRRVQVTKLGAEMEREDVQISEKLIVLKRNLSAYHVTQILMLVAIISLSVFKFN